MAAATTMSSKGQVIIPKEVRVALRWTPGTQLSVEVTDDGVLLRAENPFPPATLDELVGCVNYSGPRRTLAEMTKGIARGARKHK